MIDVVQTDRVEVRTGDVVLVVTETDSGLVLEATPGVEGLRIRRLVAAESADGGFLMHLSGELVESPAEVRRA